MTPACFRDAAHRHHCRVRTYAAWMIGDLDTAGDVAQEAFLRLWMHHERVAREAALTWLLTTAHRLVLDRLSRRRPTCTDLAGVLAESTGADPVDRTISREETGALTSAIGRLPQRDRALLLLREQHGLSMADIGRVLDMPVGTVKAGLHRARRRLCEALPDEDRNPAPIPTEVLA